MKSYLIDTNIILRFLTGEPETQAAQTKQLIEHCEAGVLSLRILPLVVAEVVFVLSGKFYALKRAAIATALIQFLQTPSFDVEDRDTLLLALQLFSQHNIDYADAYLAAESTITGSGVASFDQDFKKIPSLDLYSL
ncbi:MAG: PIN domain-containing protein [Opitutaceae bacterium]